MILEALLPIWLTLSVYENFPTMDNDLSSANLQNEDKFHKMMISDRAHFLEVLFWYIVELNVDGHQMVVRKCV